jgi:predicted permease
MFADRLRDFRQGFRQILQRPGFALAAIASLALGIGANTVLFGLVNTLLWQPIPGVSDASRLVEIGRGSPDSSFDTFGWPDVQDLQAATPALDAVFAFQIQPLNVRASGDPRRALGFVVTESYFETLGVHAALGRTFVAADAGKLDATPGVVISDATWRTHFQSDPQILGRPVVVNGSSFQVMGVAPPAFRGHIALLQPEFYIPLTLAPLVNADARGNLASRDARWLLAGGRLAPGATADQAREQLAAVAARLAAEYPESHRDMRIDLAPLTGLPAAAHGPVQLFAGAMFALVALVLLLACVNVAGMLLARGEARSAEIAVRTAIGASRRRLVYQLFAEGLVLAALAGAAGLALAWLGRRLLSLVHVPAPFPVELTLPIDGNVLAFAAVLSFATAGLFAVWPALRVSQRAPRAALAAGGATDTRARTRARDLLVVVQFAVSLVLLVAAALFMRSLQRAADIDPGFRSEGVSYAEFDMQPSGYPVERTQALLQQMLERIRSEPGVESASMAATLPLSLNRLGLGMARNPARPDDIVGPDANSVGTDFFRTLSIPVRGREFAATDREGSGDVAIINQALAEQLFGAADPLGRSVELGWGEDWQTLQVVGVATDGKYASLSEERTPFLFLPHAQYPHLSMHLLVRGAHPPLALERILRRELSALDPNLPPPSVHALADVTSISVLPQRIAGYVASAVGTVGALLAATGLYGLMAYYVVQRRREIGVRLALGASRETILRAIVWRAARLAGIGLAVGLVLAAILAQLLSSLLFGVHGTDLLAFVAAALGLAAAAALATFGPAWRAASVPPSQALRYE